MTATVQIVVTPGSGEGRAMGTARHLQRLLENLTEGVVDEDVPVESV